MWLHNISLVIFNIVILTGTNGTPCTKDKMVGKDKAWTFSEKVDTGTGQLFMMRHDDYLVPCCGVITEWHIYIKQPGTIRLQIWRPLGTGEYTLVGENMATYNKGEEENYFKTIVDDDQVISVKEGDFVGWYNENDVMVSYNKEKKGVGALIMTSSDPVEVDDTLDWSEVVATESRSYALDYIVAKGLQPKFSNLNGDITIVNNIAPMTQIYKLTFAGVTDVTIPKSFTVTLDTYSEYFEYNVSENSVFIKETPTPGKYSLEFTVKDQCGGKSSGKLAVNVKTKLPTILNLPMAVVLREDIQYGETLMTTLDVVHSGPVACNLKGVSPSSGKRFFLVRNNNASIGVYLKATARLQYKQEDFYELTIKCSSGKESDTKTMIVNVEPNSAPNITNLPASVQVRADTGIIGSYIYLVTSNDVENDAVFYNVTCDPPPCPFNITKAGSVFIQSDVRNAKSDLIHVKVYAGDSYNMASPEYLTVNITGLNHPPFIYNMPDLITITLEENTPPGTSLFQALALDQDPGDNITFSMKIKPSPMVQYFKIDENSGIVTALQSLDYDGLKQKNAKIFISVSDGEESSEPTGSLKVSLSDLNEPPVFSAESYTVYVPEGKTGSDTGAKIKAKDSDKNDAVSYSLGCGNETDRFQINERTAVVEQLYGLDVDQIGVAEVDIVCNVTAADKSGLSSSVPLHFIVMDENDNTPDFKRTSYLFVVTRDLPVFTEIGQTYATDADTSPANSKLFYHIVEVNYDFVVDDNGTIHILKDLSSVPIGTVYRFTMTSEDGGKKHDNVPVTIVVLAGNYSTLVASLLAAEMTFLDDPGNVAWVITAVYLGVLLTILAVYMCYRICYCSVGVRCKHDIGDKNQFGSKDPSLMSLKSKGKMNNLDSSQRSSVVSLISVEPAPFPIQNVDNKNNFEKSTVSSVYKTPSQYTFENARTSSQAHYQQNVKSNVAKVDQETNAQFEQTFSGNAIFSRNQSPKGLVDTRQITTSRECIDNTVHDNVETTSTHFLPSSGERKEREIKLPTKQTECLDHITSKNHLEHINHFEENVVNKSCSFESQSLSGNWPLSRVNSSPCSLSDIHPLNIDPVNHNTEPSPWKPWAISDFKKDGIPTDSFKTSERKSRASTKHLNF